MTTDFTPHSPQADYTATIMITASAEELYDLYVMLQEVESAFLSPRQKRIRHNLLNELRSAHDLLKDMEDAVWRAESNLSK